MENFNHELKPTSIVFYIQSPDDFYKQMHEFNEAHYTEPTIENTDLACKMLNDIGVNLK